MRKSNVARLLLLAAIWSGSFIFMRVLAPILGPIATAGFRLLLAGAVLSIYFKIIGFDVQWKKNIFHYLAIGIVNSALPFVLYSFAALYIPASLSVILNSSSPLFGSIFAAIWLSENLSLQKCCGLILGMTGVALVAVKEAISFGEFGLVAVVACLAASMCYGLAGIYIKKFGSHLKPLAIAGASQFAAGIVLIPLIFLSPVRAEIDTHVVLNMLGLSILCSAFAYILYFQLIADVGPSRALTVTFLMPAFGIIWGITFLGESVTAQMIIGCKAIICGTMLVLFSKSKAQSPSKLTA